MGSQCAPADSVTPAGAVRATEGAVVSSTSMVWVQLTEAVFSQSSMAVNVQVRTKLYEPPQMLWWGPSE